MPPLRSSGGVLVPHGWSTRGFPPVAPFPSFFASSRPWASAPSKNPHAWPGASKWLASALACCADMWSCRSPARVHKCGGGRPQALKQSPRDCNASAGDLCTPRRASTPPGNRDRPCSSVFGPNTQHCKRLSQNGYGLYIYVYIYTHIYVYGHTDHPTYTYR